MTYIVNFNQITEVTAAAVNPVSLTEAKAQLRVDGTDSDTEIAAMISAATVWCEAYLQASLVQRTYRADVEGFAQSYRLPRPPLLSLTSVKYYTPDSPQVLTTLSDYYRVDAGRGEIYMDADASATPSIATRRDAVQITYVAGFAATSDSPQDLAGNVPAPIKQAILMQVGEMFERRSTNSEMRLQETPTVKMLLAPYREY